MFILLGVIKKLKPSTKPGAVSKSEVIGIAVGTTTLLLTTLRDAARLAPLPLVQNAASIALDIITIVQGAQENKDDFQRLADDACSLVYAVVLQTRTASKDDSDISNSLHHNLQGLTKTLSKIQVFASKKVKNKMYLRIIQQASDIRVIRQYREALRQSLDLFGLKSSITIQENIAALAAQQKAILKELKGHNSKEKDASQSSWEHLLGSRDISVMFPRIQSSHGTFDFTSIGKDQNYVDSSHHISCINSSNNTTTMMTDAGNDSSVKFLSGGEHNATAMGVDLASCLPAGHASDGQHDDGQTLREQDSVKKGSEIWSHEKVQSTEMLDGVHMHKLAKVVHEKVALPPPIQRKDDDMQTMEHDRRRKWADTVPEDALRDLGGAGGMYNHTLDGSGEGLQVGAPVPLGGLNHGSLDEPPVETAFQETPDRIMFPLASKNPFHQASKNPFVQPHHESRPTANDLYQYSHPVRSDSYPSENHTFQPQAHSRTMSAPLLEQKKHKLFPTIQSSTEQFNITHVGGDQNFADSSSHATNFNSGNTTTTITTNSNNDSSIRVGIGGPRQYTHNMKLGKMPPFTWDKHISAKSP